MPLKSSEIFTKISQGIEHHGAAVVEKVQSVYMFEIRETKAGEPTIFTIDLKNGKGTVKEGKIEGVKPDATFVMLDDDFV